ncbi:MAG: S8 family serine peptidase [Chloroflexi bacterium]|nr:S8 family serine peptidase [Chloroflexota bacterium]
MRSQREGDLPTAQAVAAQRQSIQTAQSAVLSELAATNFNVTARFTTIPFLALEVSGEGLAALESSNLIVDIQEDRINTVSLGSSIPVINADDVWALGIDGAGIAVAILDTGVDSSHPFLSGKVKAEACFTTFGGCPNGFNQQIGPGAGVPCASSSSCNHGTHVAGIAAGKGANSGVAREADLIAIQVFSPVGGGIGAFDSDIVEGLEHVLADDLIELIGILSLGVVFSLISVISLASHCTGFVSACHSWPLLYMRSSRG